MKLKASVKANNKLCMLVLLLFLQEKKIKHKVTL